MSTADTEPSTRRPDSSPPSGIRTFVLLWCSQWLVVFAAALTVLVFRLDIFAEFDSLGALIFAFLVLFAPFALLSPAAGALVDRYGHRRVLIASNIGYLINLGALVVVLLMDIPLLWPLIVVLAIDAILKAPQLAALESAVPLLVPRRLLIRANAPRMLLTVTGVVLGPLVVALALTVVAPVGVILLECAAVVVAILVVRTLDIPVVPKRADDAARRSLGAEVLSTWSHLRSRPGLLPVLGFLAGVSCVISILEGAGPENVYAFAGETGIMIVFASGWVGMLVTSIVMIVTGRPRRLARGLFSSGVVFAVALLVAAARPNVAVMAVGAFIALGSTAVFVACVQTVLHSKVDPRHLGRAMGFKNLMVAGPHMIGSTIVVTVGAGLVTVIGRDEVRSPAVSALVGDAAGRSWAVVMMGGAAFVAVVVALVSRSLHVRRVDDLPDVTPGDRVDPALAGPTVSADLPAATSTPARR
ncbi:MFS transporter [Micromonospora profundi]|uniref:MFS transporter n=1 Tax=Micromonospora TaxID=1873 RepID=UPI0033B03B5A